MKMDTDLIHAPAVGLTEEEEADMNDWKLPLAFMKKRHSEKIEGSKALAQSWRMKDRVNIWLVLLLPLALSILNPKSSPGIKTLLFVLPTYMSCV